MPHLDKGKRHAHNTLDKNSAPPSQHQQKSPRSPAVGPLSAPGHMFSPDTTRLISGKSPAASSKVAALRCRLEESGARKHLLTSQVQELSEEVVQERGAQEAFGEERDTALQARKVLEAEAAGLRACLEQRVGLVPEQGGGTPGAARLGGGSANKSGAQEKLVGREHGSCTERGYV